MWRKHFVYHATISSSRIRGVAQRSEINSALESLEKEWQIIEENKLIDFAGVNVASLRFPRFLTQSAAGIFWSVIKVDR